MNGITDPNEVPSEHMKEIKKSLLNLDVGVVRLLVLKYNSEKFEYVFGKSSSLNAQIRAFKEPNVIEDASKAMIEMFNEIQNQL